MSALDFIPEVWTSGDLPPMLVCGRRWMRGKSVKGAEVETTFEWISHPAAIFLTAPPAVCLGFKTGEGDTAWKRHAPKEFGIPTRAAALAVSEAMRCVKVSHDLISSTAQCETTAHKLVTFRKGAILRNITVWLAWGHWEARKATFEERRADIEAQGFTMTPKAFRRLLEDAGMSI